MNEELKIIIKAVTDGAKKGINDVRKELEGVSKGSGKAGANFGAAMKGIAKGAAVAVGAIVAVGAALVALGKNSLDYNKAQAKLITGFQAVGLSAQQAATSYNGLYRFLGDSDKAVEAAGHLAKLTQNEKNLAEWTKITQGVYATFGDSISTEGLTEAANETARVGKLTGTLTDALNWAGVSEDAFNAKLAQTNTLEEREALIRTTLNGLYSDAAEIYEKNNKSILEYNESQARVEASMGAAGKSVYPLMTALNNLSAVLLDALKPALDIIVPAMSTFIGWITKGIQTVMSFFGVITGKSTSVSTTLSGINDSVSGMGAGGTDKLASGLDGVAASAEKAKRATMGFDELNVVSSGSSSGSSGSGTPAYAPGSSGFGNGGAFSTEIQEGEQKASGFAKVMQDLGDKLKDVFAPTVTAWSSAFDQLKGAWEDTKPRFVNGANDIMDSFKSVGGYVVGTFVPDVVNSFSTNLAPMIGDYMSLVLDQTGKNFEAFGYIISDSTDNILLPAFDVIKQTVTDTFESFGTAWEEHGQPLIDKATEALDHIRGVFVSLYEEFLKPVAENIIAVFEQLWNEHLKPLVDKVVEAAMEIGECLLQLYNEFIAPIIDWIVANVVPIIKDWFNKLVEHFGRVIGFIADAIGGVIDVIKGVVQFIVGVFTMDWEKAWEGIKNIFSGIWDIIVGIAQAAWELIKYPFEQAGEFFGRIWDTIKLAFEGVGNWFGNLFSSAWDAIKKAFSGVGNWFKGIWQNIKDAFGNIGDWFKNKFSDAWQKVKDVFSKGGKIFDGIKDGILNGLKTVINGLIGGINKVIKVPFDGINWALNKIKSIEIVGIKPFNWISTISVPQIPKLAKGGVVDEATLALIGERGKEAVVPLENNIEWMDKFIDKLLSRSNGQATIILQVGDTELGRAAVRGINNITRQTGVNPLLI